MHLVRFAGALALSVALIPGAGAQGLVVPATEKKIDALLAQMTLEEKVGQLNQYSSAFDVTGPPPSAGAQKVMYDQVRQGLVGSLLNVTGAETTRKMQQLAVENSRLKIPMIFGLDVIHGYRTMFPVPLAEAASFDVAAIEQSARISAIEAAAAGVHWTFAPMVDVARDARWGRIMEGSGEDVVPRRAGRRRPRARLPGEGPGGGRHHRGLREALRRATRFAEAGRDYNTVDISEQTLRNVILPPFKAAADAGAATFMNSFNEIGGIPATGNPHLQRDILKGEWGFQGFVVSDWGSIGEMIPHGFAENLEQAAVAGDHRGQRHGHGVAGVRRRTWPRSSRAGRWTSSSSTTRSAASCASSSPSASSTIPTATPTRPARSRPCSTRPTSPPRATWPASRSSCSRTRAASCRSTRP